MISVALIEDNRLMREGMTVLLNQTTCCNVVAATATADIELLKSLNPQVVLLDLALRKGDSLRVAEAVRPACPDTKVVVMDLLPMHEELVEFAQAGVSGFILKDATLDDMVHTIRSVVDGKHIIPPDLASSLLSQIARDAVVGRRPEVMSEARLTPRELEIIDLVAEGLSNKRIATRLSIAPQTVKSHIRNIMEKLTLHSRLQIAAYAYKNG